MDNALDMTNELLDIRQLNIAVYNETVRRLEYAPNLLRETVESKPTWRSLVQDSLEGRTCLAENGMQASPLVVKAGSSSRCIGVLCLVGNGVQQESDYLLLELITRYVVIVIFSAVVELVTRYQNIKTAQDEAHRASWEDSLLHVQNMVFDNCLSTIKHETIYYPSRIGQLTGKLRSSKLSEVRERETVAAISKLTEYYKGVFVILGQCTSRQLEEVIFRRTVIPVSKLSEATEKYLRKVHERIAMSAIFKAGIVNESVVGGIIQLRSLLGNSIDEALSMPVSGKITLTCAVEKDFVRFLFTDA